MSVNNLTALFDQYVGETLELHAGEQLVEAYELPDRHVYHLDLYRLADPEELEFLGLRDWLAEDAVLLVEWPGKGEGMLPQADVVVEIEYAGSARRVNLQPISDSGRQFIEKLADLTKN